MPAVPVYRGRFGRRWSTSRGSCARSGATFRARWVAANYAIGDRRALDPDGPYDTTEDAPGAVARALAFWGRPTLSVETRRQLLAYAERCQAGIEDEWQERPYRVLRLNALRMLIATSPDLMTS